MAIFWISMINCTNSFYTAQLSWRPYVTAQSALCSVGLLFFNSLFIHTLRQRQHVGRTEAAFGQLPVQTEWSLQFPDTFKHTLFAMRHCSSAIWDIDSYSSFRMVLWGWKVPSESGAIHNRIRPISIPPRLFVLNRVLLFDIAHKAIARRASLSKDLFTLVLKIFSGILK